MSANQKIALVIAFTLGLLCAYLAKYCYAEPLVPEQESFWTRLIPDGIKNKIQVSQQLQERAKQEQAFLDRCIAQNPELFKDAKVQQVLAIFRQENMKDYYKELTGSNEVPTILSEPEKYKNSPAPVREWLHDKPIRRIFRDFTQPASKP